MYANHAVCSLQISYNGVVVDAEIAAGASSPRIMFTENHDGVVLGLERPFKF